MAPQSSGVWFKNAIEGDRLFRVTSVFANYTTPFLLSDMGSLTEIREAMGPDGTTPLGDFYEVRIAIGNWSEGGPRETVICYVDHLMIISAFSELVV